MNFAAYMRSHALRLAASLILLAALGALLLPLGVSTDGTILILIIAAILWRSFWSGSGKVTRNRRSYRISIDA